jgi:hypothetical protein
MELFENIICLFIFMGVFIQLPHNDNNLKTVKYIVLMLIVLEVYLLFKRLNVIL